MKINRWFLVTASFLFATSFPALQFAASPTIVVFLADDHGFGDSTPYGSPDARTPHLQQLADEGMVFQRAFVASPSCAPSRTAMLTGLMPARNGAEANHTFKRDSIASLPDQLRQLGYETAAFGKVAHGKHDSARHGFDHLDGKHTVEIVEKYLKERDADKPLCLFVGTHSPHVPWPKNIGYDPSKLTLPATFVDTPETRKQRSEYLSAVTQADIDLGDIYAMVRKRFDPTKTLFFYTSDHGAQVPFAKWNLYDVGTRVPFIAVWPSIIAPGQRSDAMIQWIDLIPTLIDVSGGDPPANIDGRSFAGVLRDPERSHRHEIFTTHSGDQLKNVYPIRALRTDRFKYILNLYPEHAHTTHIDQGGGSGIGWKYFDEWVSAGKSNPWAASRVEAYHRRPAEELYDLVEDPKELKNLASDPKHASQLLDLRTRLELWMVAQGDERKIFQEPKSFDNLYPARE